MDNKVIKEISKITKEQIKTFTSMGVKNGLAGVSLFYYYNSLYNEKKEDSKVCIKFLEKSIEGLNENYKGDNIIRDIIEIAQLVDFYVENNILNKRDVEFYFENFNEILEDLLDDEINKRNLNPVFGAINFGYYFLNAKNFISKSNQARIINKIYILIKDLVIEENELIFWKSDIKRDGKNLVEFNFTHGVAGIVNFLLTAYETKILENQEVYNIINKAIKFILRYKKAEGDSLFPFDMESENGKNFSLNLIYGDIGIGYTIHKAGKILNENTYIKSGIDILINASKFRDYEENYMEEANLNYGCLGLSSFFRFINEIESNECFEKASVYWHDMYPKFKVHQNKWAGFESINNKWDINTELSFGHGIIGIGLALMSYEKNLDLDFLRFYNYY
jgi:hypothetical protein